MYDRERWNARFEQEDPGGSKAFHHAEALRSHGNEREIAPQEELLAAAKALMEEIVSYGEAGWYEGEFVRLQEAINRVEESEICPPDAPPPDAQQE